MRTRIFYWLAFATLLALLVSCAKKEGGADAGAITPSSLSLSYGQEARISAKFSPEQSFWVVAGAGEEGTPVQIISQGPEGAGATFALVKA